MTERRQILRGLGALAFGSAVSLPGSAIAQYVPSNTSARQAIRSLHLSILLSLAAKNTEGAKRLAMQLVDYSRVDPNWFTYSESFSIAAILFKLTPKTDYKNWLMAARGLVECLPGMNGDIVENVLLMGSATEGVLKAVMAGQMPELASKKLTLANYLLEWAGAAPGAERVGWARYGLSVIKSSKAGVQTELINNSAADLRFISAAVGLAGDWPGALQMLQRHQAVLDQPGGVEKPSGSAGGGFIAFSNGRESFDAELATAMAMSGRVSDALVMLEKSRRQTPTLAMRGINLAGSEALKAEAQLINSGTILVNLAVTIAGTLVIISAGSGGKVVRTVHLHPDAGGILLPARTVNSGAFHFKQDGLIAEYNKARKEGAAKRQAKLAAYVKRAANDAELFVGKALRAAFAKAKLSPYSDVVVAQPAAVAFLPLALVSGENNGNYGLGRPLRFVDSIASAASAENGKRKHQASPPQLGIMALDPAAGGPAFSPLEAAAVRALTSKARGTVDPAPAVAPKVLEWPVGRTYWHISSHASWNAAKPQLSGIALGGKKIARIADVAAMRPTPSPRLVFLSCCETALLNTQEQIDKYLSLPTAFLSIGAGGVIASHWPVSDAASALLSARFYHEHFINAQIPVAALGMAQRWLGGSTAGQLSQFINDLAVADAGVRAELGGISAFLLQHDGNAKPFADPYYWGGFQLYGT